MPNLLIWQEIPENTYAYKFDTDEHLDLLRGCHNRYINMDDKGPDDPLNKLSKVLEKMERFPTNKPIKGPWNRVFISGFIL